MNSGGQLGFWRRVDFGARRPISRVRLLISSVVMLLITTLLVYLLASRYVMQTVLVVGDSMEPTLHDGDYRFCWSWKARFRSSVEVGEVVVIHFPGRRERLVKRVVALPGDMISIRQEQVLVNGRRLVESYLPAGTRTPSGPLRKGVYQLPPGCYFVLGDNRANSLDSRFFGGVRHEWIAGVVQTRSPLSLAGHAQASDQILSGKGIAAVFSPNVSQLK